MPVTLERDPEKRIARIRVWGVLQQREIFQLQEDLRRLFEEGSLDSSWSEIVEVGEIEGGLDQISSDSLSRLAALDPWPEDSPRAFVAPTDITFGLARMYEFLSQFEGKRVRIVRTQAEAMDWVTNASSRALENDSLE